MPGKKDRGNLHSSARALCDAHGHVLVRIDSTDPGTISMSVGTNSTSLFASPAPAFMRPMPDNGKLFLRATGYQGKQADGTFNLGDVSVARDRIAETCHWSTPKADQSPPPCSNASASPGSKLGGREAKGETGNSNRRTDEAKLGPSGFEELRSIDRIWYRQCLRHRGCPNTAAGPTLLTLSRPDPARPLGKGC
jgi:hypothetical protein